MKIIGIVGNIWKSQTLLKDLTKTHHLKDGQIVSLYNALQNEMHVISNQIPDNDTHHTAFETELKLVEGNLLEHLSTSLDCPVVGHMYGYHNDTFIPYKAKLNDMVTERKKLNKHSHSYYHAIVSNKDIKYVDVLIIYNIVDPINFISAIERTKRIYGSTITPYCLHIVSTGDSLFDEIEVTASSSIGNRYKKGTVADLLNAIPTIVNNELFSQDKTADTEVVTLEVESDEPDIASDIFDPSRYNGNARIYEQLRGDVNRYRATYVAEAPSINTN